MAGIPTYSPGPRRDGWIDKRMAVWIGVVVTLATSLITYTVTVTMLYADIRNEAALLSQRVEFLRTMSDQEHVDLRLRVAGLEAWIKGMQTQIDRDRRP